MNKTYLKLIFVFVFIDLSICNDANNNENENWINIAVRSLKEKFTNTNNENNYSIQVLEAVENTTECLNNIINIDILQRELRLAMLDVDDLTLVFNNYCQIQEDIFQCINIGTNDYIRGLSEKEKNQINSLLNIIKKFIKSTVCRRGGNQMAIIIHQNHLECFTTKNTKLEKCMNRVYSNYTQIELLNIPSYYINDNTCEDLSKIRNCVIPVLEECSESMASILANNFFEDVWYELTCDRNTLDDTDSKFNEIEDD